jgi:hypothetical protein
VRDRKREREREREKERERERERERACMKSYSILTLSELIWYTGLVNIEFDGVDELGELFPFLNALRPFQLLRDKRSD